MSAAVELQTHDGVARITLRAVRSRNALSSALTSELLAHLDAAEGAREVFAVVIAAEGPAFCSGLDLREAIREGMDVATKRLVQLQRKILALPKPVIARVHASARAGGLGLIASADIAVAAQSATFAFTEARLGVAPTAISPVVRSTLSRRDLADLWLTGREVTADEATAMGFLTSVVADRDVDDALERILVDVRRANGQGLAACKRLVNADLLASLDNEGEVLASKSAGLFDSPIARDAIGRFLARK